MGKYCGIGQEAEQESGACTPVFGHPLFPGVLQGRIRVNIQDLHIPLFHMVTICSLVCL